MARRKQDILSIRLGGGTSPIIMTHAAVFTTRHNQTHKITLREIVVENVNEMRFFGNTDELNERIQEILRKLEDHNEDLKMHCLSPVVVVDITENPSYTPRKNMRADLFRIYSGGDGKGEFDNNGYHKISRLNLISDIRQLFDLGQISFRSGDDTIEDAKKALKVARARPIRETADELLLMANDRDECMVLSLCLGLWFGADNATFSGWDSKGFQQPIEHRI